MSRQGQVVADRASDASRQAVTGRSFTSGFSWRNIIFAFALLAILGYSTYRLVWPASYSGDVRWGVGGTTLRLVATGQVLDVSDNTAITLNGDVNPDYVRSRAGRLTSPFLAQVVYRPYVWRKVHGAAAGWAQSIDER
jgi:hypothetical protein